MIRIGIIIPDRGDRPSLLKNCLRMMAAQTIKPEFIELVNDDPLNEKCDITRRYRVGYDRLRNKNLDVIALVENDDWYCPEYLETMVQAWGNYGKPDIFGTCYTIYYHLKLKSYFTFQHFSRASAMNTLIKPDLNFPWCPDHEPFTDIHLWNTLKGVTFKPEKNISMGMKHGQGMCGGKLHIDRLHRYVNKGEEFLKQTLDPDSYKFYSSY